MTTEHATVNRIDTEGKSTAILVVDDEPDILFFVVHALQCMGMTVACAGNGEQALSLLATRPFAVMLTDLNMPGMNGLELARQARGLQPLLTIILGTGHLSRGIHEQAAQAGISEVIGKPFEIETIFRLICKALA
ncbi:hypothetical protein GURASL_24780 [Geotalea uraniireducens]|uniref:Response regulatory domain-containing protein n=1 Tax=Geotalea uraniireducens TaxID=351604 RepID=A0ABM8ENE4_9BACT|nr:response regulator [Geotalea uraniireducens]BDV43555.1 hypothetical protein GURASL_24780 [Geotalea uraniireducens]